MARRRKSLGVAPCASSPDSVRPICRVVEDRQARKIARTATDRVQMDLYTASAIMAVYDSLNPVNREKFAALPLRKMSTVAFRLLSKRS